MPHCSYIPVVIEVKGIRHCLEKKNTEHEITNLTKKGEPDYATIQKYAVNGAVHYAEAIINYTESYDHVIAVGINGYRDATDKIRMEYGVYYVSRENMLIPKKSRHIRIYHSSVMIAWNDWNRKSRRFFSARRKRNAALLPLKTVLRRYCRNSIRKCTIISISRRKAVSSLSAG